MDPFTPQQLFADGDRLFQAGQPLEAVSAWLSAFTGDPDFTEPLRERLRAAYSGLWSSLPRDPDLEALDYIALARVHSEADRHDKSLALLSKAGALQPDSGDIHLGLGEAYFLQAFETQDRRPLFDRAIDHLSVAVLLGTADRSPERTGELYYFVGASHFFRDEDEEAVANLQNAAELNPGKAEAHFFLGLALRRLGRPEEAASSLEKACAIAADAYNLQQLGNCYLELGRKEDALVRLREARAMNPGLVDLHRDLGVALIQKAETEFDAVASAALAEGRAPEELGISAFLAREDVQEAMSELKGFVEQARAMPDRATREKVRLLRGTAGKALPTDRLEAPPKKGKPSGFAFVGFGAEGPRATVKDDIVRDPLGADLRAARERFELFQGAAERSSKDCSDLGLTWFHRKLYAAAVVAFQEALSKDASLAEVHQYAAAAWSHLGQDERAVRASEEALRLGAKLVEPHRDLGLFYLTKSAEALPPLAEDALDADVYRTINLLRAMRRGAERERAVHHFRHYVEHQPQDEELGGFLRKLIATYEGDDTTLENVFHLAVNETLLKERYVAAEALLLELDELVDKPHKEAVRDRLEEVRRLRKTEARIHHERGNLMMATGQTQRGLAEYRSALDLDPDLDKAHYNLAMALYESGEAAGALEHIQRFLDLRADAGGKLPDFPGASPGALETRLQWGDAQKKMQRVEQEASVLLVKLQAFQTL
jgi:tetratricopeptide (TPR) repeat protein